MTVTDANGLHKVHLADVAPTPWRNGGGRTHELQAWPLAPKARAAEDWLLRVSVADVEQSGPFSAFPGVQRWFAVLSGAGVRLHLPGGPAHVRRDGEALCFDGAAAPNCDLLDGPTRDLNFMLRGPSSLGALGSLARARSGSSLQGALRWRGLYTSGVAQVRIGAEEVLVEPDTLLWSDDPAPTPWTLLQGGSAWWLVLQP